MNNLKLMLFSVMLISFLNNSMLLAQKEGKETEVAEIVYPIKIKKQDGTVVTVNNEEQHDKLYEETYKEEEQEQLEYVFPIKIKKDGVVKTIKNEEELEKQLYSEFGE